jgi:Flp pilus assembly protein TadG
MSAARPLCRCEAGVVSIEGAVVLLAYLFLVFGIMELLYALFAYSTVVRGAENAARYAMVHNACSVTAANTQVGVVPLTIVSSGCTPAPASCQAGGTTYQTAVFQVTVSYTFQSIFAEIFAPELPIQATVCVPLVS